MIEQKHRGRRTSGLSTRLAPVLSLGVRRPVMESRDLPVIIKSSWPGLLTAVSFLIMYFVTKAAYDTWAPGVPDHGQVEVPVMPSVMWYWGQAYGRTGLRGLWLIGWMAYAVPVVLGFWYARTGAERRSLVTAIGVILLYSFQRILAWAVTESELRAFLDEKQVKMEEVLSLFGMGAFHIVTAVVAGRCVAAILRRTWRPRRTATAARLA